MIFNLITFKRRSQIYIKKIDIGESRSKSSDLLLEQLRIFSIEIGKKIMSREDFRSCAKHVIQIIKRFTILNEDEIIAEEVKKIPCLSDKSSRSYRDRGVVRNA